MATKILLVDDDSQFTSKVGGLLERGGYDLRIASDGIQCLQSVADFQPALILLDILLPKLDGQEVLRRIRVDGDRPAIIVLTVLSGNADRIQALNAGADDYINKPFDQVELLARIWAVLRRAYPLWAAKCLVSGRLELCRSAHTVKVDGKEVRLGARAFSLLEFLMLRPGEVQTYDRLLEVVWNKPDIDLDAVHQRINDLRAALNDHNLPQPRYVQNVRGEGYCFVGEVRGIPW